MLLALDVGNTHTVVGLFERQKIQGTWRVSTHPLCTADEFKFKLEMMLLTSGIHLDKIPTIVVSSVVPTFTRMLQASFPSTKLHIIDYQWPFSFTIKPNPPEQVGADRLVNAETVVREYGYPSIVMDSGTATTICAITKGPNGPEYLGGAILAGIELSMQALAKNAAQLFTIELTAPSHAIGHNTQDALKSGIMLGYASMIDGMISRFRDELGGGSIPVVATGGISHLMRGLAQELTHFDSDLTLKGIAYLYDAISKK